MGDCDQDLASRLRQAGIVRGDPGQEVSRPTGRRRSQHHRQSTALPADTALQADGLKWLIVTADEARCRYDLRLRWVTWSAETAARLCGRGVRLSTSWDVAAVHRLLFGGWHAGPGLAWASIRGLAADGLPAPAPGTLFGAMSSMNRPSDDPGRTRRLPADRVDGRRLGAQR